MPERLRGAAYGLRQSLDSIGALLGPVLGIVLLAWLLVDIRTALWVAVIPAALAVLVLVVAVREPERAAHARVRAPIRLADARRLAGRYWLVGALWQTVGPAATFYAGAAFTAVALVALMSYCPPANP